MILAIDIGGTSAKMGLSTRDGIICEQREVPVAFDHYRTPILQTVIREAEGMVRDAEGNVEGIAVSATGQTDDRLGIVIGTNGKIANYEGARIREEMEEHFGIPCRALNDANAAVLGEAWKGCAVGMQNVVMITLGTGVGGGVVTDGRLMRGRRGIAGELGHFTLYQDGKRCTCGKRGCFESYASTTALIHRAMLATGESDLEGRKIFSRAEQGDPVMLQTIDQWTDDIAAGISGLVHIFNPEMVVIGGGVSRQETLLIQPLTKKVLESVMPRFAEGLRIQRAVLGNDAGMIGAIRFFLDQTEN